MKQKYLLFAVIYLYSLYLHGFELKIGPNYTSFDYKELLTAPSKSTEKSQFVLTKFEIENEIGKELYILANYSSVSKIKSNYDGSTLESGEAVTATNELSFTDWNVEFGYRANNSVELFFGYGFRLWDRLLNGGSPYREKYSWNYYLFGAQYFLLNSNTTEIAVRAGLKQMVSGKIKIITSEFYDQGDDSEVNLGNKSGVFVKFPIKKFFTQKFFAEVIPWYEQSEIGESAIVSNTTLAPTPGTGIYEPSSKTTQIGLELLFGLRF